MVSFRNEAKELGQLLLFVADEVLVEKFEQGLFVSQDVTVRQVIVKISFIHDHSQLFVTTSLDFLTFETAE